MGIGGATSAFPRNLQASPEEFQGPGHLNSFLGRRHVVSVSLNSSAGLNTFREWIVKISACRKFQLPRRGVVRDADLDARQRFTT
jgi:hypothetical protein